MFYNIYVLFYYIYGWNLLSLRLLTVLLHAFITFTGPTLVENNHPKHSIELWRDYKKNAICILVYFSA